ncbi:hypothetical protein RJZ90_001218 [Blastomyces dermatitidis]
MGGCAPTLLQPDCDGDEVLIYDFAPARPFDVILAKLLTTVDQLVPLAPIASFPVNKR